ncbi:MAG: hypothetical protein GY731_07980 [Gammaproteobacteria bacterium]|nr:hypothetical protein [Gammaproteobacteria bacterium]
MNWLGLATTMLAICLYTVTQPVSATTGSVTSSGAFSAGISHDTGWRERVELTGADGLFAGWPTHPSIVLLTVYAPDVDAGQVILRDLQRPDGTRSILLTAPESLREKTRRVTIYLHRSATEAVILESVGGRWQRREPLPLRVSMPNQSGMVTEELLAFSVSGLGHYWLVEGQLPSRPPNTEAPADHPADSLPGGDTFRALETITAAIVLLLVGWAASHWTHRLETHAGE